jgi:hypothetical protein
MERANTMSNHMPIANQSGRRDAVDGESSKADSPSPITVEDTLMGTDPPIEQAHPGLQPALVFASYPIVLIILISIVAIYFAFFRSAPSTIDARPEQSEIAK